MTKLNSRLTRVAMPWPAERVSSGCISEGYSHPRGPPVHREAACSVMALSVKYTCTRNSSGQQTWQAIGMLLLGHLMRC